MQRVREKLVNDKEKAYLSLDLGTIRTDAPIDKNASAYVVSGGDKVLAAAEAARLELFSLIDKFGLNRNDAKTEVVKRKAERNYKINLHLFKGAS